MSMERKSKTLDFDKAYGKRPYIWLELAARTSNMVRIFRDQKIFKEILVTGFVLGDAKAGWLKEVVTSL